MNTNTLIAIIGVSLFTLIGVSIITEKSEHKKRMELIEEKQELVNLLNQQQIQKGIFETEQMIREIDSMLIVSK
jgi:hypothetical protein